MGRPREHDQQAVRDRVMRCFWELGFESASIATLETAAGIDRRQLSRDYGNKRALFLQSLDDFTVFAGRLYLDRLEQVGSSLDDISTTLRQLAGSSRQPFGHLGCLICNTSLEAIASADTEVRAKIHAFFLRIEGAYTNALRQAAETGAVSADPRHIKASARQLLGAHIALLSLARGGMPDDVLGDIADRALASLVLPR